jgi:hypothetical protein
MTEPTRWIDLSHPVIRDQHDPAMIERIPQKPAGPTVIDATPPPPAAVRENTAWMAAQVPDTTALGRGTAPDTPPTVLAPVGGDDLFQTRRIAPPPPADAARRAVSPYLGDQAANLRQHVYGWAQEVLRWDAARRRMGSRSPLRSPGMLRIPDEYAWHVSIRERLPLPQAWERVYMAVQLELTRLLEGTDQPPPVWRQALREAQERGPLPPDAGFFRRLLHRLRR